MKKGLFLALAALLVFALASCDDGGGSSGLTVIFNANNATAGTAPAMMRANSGDSITLPGAGSLVRSNHAFSGWNVSPGGTGALLSADDEYEVTANVVLFAQWEPGPPIYTITFNANGAVAGFAPDPRQGNVGDVITLPGQGSLFRTGYVFGGWNTNAIGTGTTYSGGAEYTVPGNPVTLYVRWVLPSFSVTFVANGGGVTNMPAINPITEVPIGTTIAQPTPNPSRSGFSFNGWFTDPVETDGTQWNFTDDQVMQNITLYAHWGEV